MMFLSSIYEDSRALLIATYIAIPVVAGLLAFFVWSHFSLRVRTPVGGRSRQPRLGIVDVFDLDRQRQLVLVRRDNVEHLIMIGGPNDVVVETEINRGQMAARPPHLEDVLDSSGSGQAALTAGSAPQPPQAPVLAPAAPIAAPVAPSPAAPAMPIAAPNAAASAAPAAPAPMAPPPLRPLRQPPLPLAMRGALPPVSGAPRPAGSAPLSSPPAAQSPLSSAPPAPSGSSAGAEAEKAPAPGPAPSAPPGSGFGALPPRAVPALRPMAPRPPVAPFAKKDEPQQAKPAEAKIDPLDALEEEMAKLLGRPSDQGPHA